MFRTKEDIIKKYTCGRVLDVGFWGQGIPFSADNHPHQLMRKYTNELFGIDTEGDFSRLDPRRYRKQSAEDFSFEERFDVIFALDLIEHLSNPGLFLKNCRKHLKPDGKLILTTPNAYNLFSMAGKLTRKDPVVNRDHTLLLTPRLLNQLANKCGLRIQSIDYLYSVGVYHKESWKKKVLNILYRVLPQKFYEDFVAVLGTSRPDE